MKYHGLLPLTYLKAFLDLWYELEVSRVFCLKIEPVVYDHQARFSVTIIGDNAAEGSFEILKASFETGMLFRSQLKQFFTKTT